ncbi:MAG: M48 family metallopeptidase, partial [Verrucomicrobiota bacterium]
LVEVSSYIELPMKHSPLTARLLPLSVLLASIAFVACTTTVPETGRKQLNMMDPKKEAALGFSEFGKMKAEKPISQDPGLNAQVQRVGSRLSKVMPVPNAEWEFVVFDDPSPNAFALPGGKVGVHTGIFQITKDDAGLAAVIGHEVAHVVARHSGERMTQNAVAGVLVAGAGYALNRDGGDGALPTAALGAGTLIATRKFSRDQELEADRMGALFMARAGYDPKESVELWRRFGQWRSANSQGGNSPQFLSTHPLDDKRIANLQYYMPQAVAEYKPS